MTVSLILPLAVKEAVRRSIVRQPLESATEPAYKPAQANWDSYTDTEYGDPA